MNILTYIRDIMKPYRGLKREVYIIAISRFVNALGALIFPFFTLILSEKIGLGPRENGFYIALTGFLFIPSGLIGGKIADRIGRKSTILFFEFMGMMTYAACIFLPTNMTMVYTLMLSSLLFGFAGPAHDALVADVSTGKEREGAYSLLYLGFNLGFAVAMVLAGRLFANHLKMMFVIDVMTALIALSLIAIFIKEKNIHTENQQEEDSDQGESLEAEVEGGILAVLKARPALIKFIGILFLYRFVYSQWGFLMPLHATENFGEQAGGALYGNLGLVNALVVVLFTAVITRMLLKWTPVNKLVVAGLLLAIGFGLLGVVSTQLAFYLSCVVFTLGEIVEAISTLPYLMNHTPKSHRARMSSVAMTIMSIGYSVSPLFFGWLLETSTYEVSWYITGLVGLIAAFGMVRISRNEQTKIRLESEKI